MEFENAVKSLSSLKEVDDGTKLKLYGLYKQSTVGKNSKSRPGLTDFVGRV